MRPYLLALALLALRVAVHADSDWVHVGPDGRLAYKADAQGNRIADFSNVGYHQGLKPIPVLSVGAFVEPTGGDATSRIQAAIDKVAKMYPNASGYRGAVFIPKGTYKISGTLYDNVRVSGAGKGGGEINLQDRGNMGTGHGWSGADQVLWNCKADRMIIQNPPTAQNWAIGCVTPNGSGDGIWDSKGQPVFPRSLYLAQLSERVAAAAVPATPPPNP